MTESRVEGEFLQQISGESNIIFKTKKMLSIIYPSQYK